MGLINSFGTNYYLFVRHPKVYCELDRGLSSARSHSLSTQAFAYVTTTPTHSSAITSSSGLPLLTFTRSLHLDLQILWLVSHQRKFVIFCLLRGSCLSNEVMTKDSWKPSPFNDLTRAHRVEGTVIQH